MCWFDKLGYTNRKIETRRTCAYQKMNEGKF